MKAEALPTEDLLRVVACDRARYRRDEATEAEEELVARLGGTYASAKRRDRVQGTVWCLLGAVTMFGGLLAFAAGFGWAKALVEPGDVDPATGAVFFALASGSGAALVLSGVALILQWKPGGLPGRIVGKMTGLNAVINREGPWPDELVQVIGSAAGSHPEAEVRAAMESIRSLHGRTLKATKRSMRVWAGIGVYAGLIGTVMVVVLLARLLRGVPGTYIDYPHLADSAPLLVRGAWDAVAITVILGFGLTLPFLLVGCAALLFCREWGRKIVSCVFGAWMAFAAGLALGELGLSPSPALRG